MYAIMDGSLPRSRGPDAGPPGERRRSVRQKLHSPVYASFNGPETGLVVDLSELLDLNEDGFAVQTGEKLEINRAITLCLELPETKSYIHGSGQVIWSDETGRGGIRFSGLSENSRQILKEWLFANLLIGSSNYMARVQQRAQQVEQREEAAPTPSAVELESPPFSPPQKEPNLFSAFELVRCEVQQLGDNTAAILQLITEHALDLTQADGAALAFQTDGEMFCRGRTGELAPPLGVPVDVKHGLTGECIRSGLLVSCEDTDRDPRVDSEVRRTLGIGSLMAVPISINSTVVGLLEVFSAEPRHFIKEHRTVLRQLIELIPETCLRNEFAGTHVLESSRTDAPSSSLTNQIASEQIAYDPVLNLDSAARSRLVNRALIGLAVVAVAMVLGYSVGPAMERRWTASRQASQPFLKSAEAAAPVARRQVKSLGDLQRLADHGDADAQWKLGVRYHDGEGVPRDDARAMQWFLRAAEQGHVMAQATLGAYYWAGRGVTPDLSKAYFWSLLAFSQGDDNSRSRLEALASQLTKAQVSAARQQAALWLRSHSERAKSEVN
jgi:GAF domain/Sel1 repeat/PilZ domain